MVRHTWKGPGVFGHKDGDVLPGKPMPEDVSEETLARLVEKGKVVKGDLPATATVTDELAGLRKQLAAANQELAGAERAHVLLVDKVEELSAAKNSLIEQLDATMEQIKQLETAGTEYVDQINTLTAANTELTEQLAVANKNVADMTALMTAAPAEAGAGPKKGGKEK